MSSFLERWRQQKTQDNTAERVDPDIGDPDALAERPDDAERGRPHARRPVYKPPSETSSLPRRRPAAGAQRRIKPVGAPPGIILATPVGADRLSLKLPRLAQAAEQMGAQGHAVLDATPRTSRVYQRHRLLSESTLAERYGEFASRAIADGLHDIEQLVPSLTLPTGTPALFEAASHVAEAAAQTLAQAVPPGRWTLPVPLSQTQTTLGPVAALAAPQLAALHRLRYRLDFIMAAVAGLCGGRLADRSVLEVGGAGVFALEAALRGAVVAEAQDPRPGHNAQMQQLAAHFGTTLPRYAPEPAADPGAPPTDTHDIVLQLGTLYRTADPVALVQQTHARCRLMAVFDGVLHREAMSAFLLGRHSNGEPVLRPTYRGLVDLLHMVGFQDVIEVCGAAPADWPDFAKDAYGSGSARCLIAFKRDV